MIDEPLGGVMGEGGMGEPGGARTVHSFMTPQSGKGWMWFTGPLSGARCGLCSRLSFRCSESREARALPFRSGSELLCLFWDKGQPSAEAVEAAEAVYSSINKRNVLLEN